MRDLSRTMIGRLTALLLTGVLIALIGVACGADPTPTPRPTATPVPPTATPVPEQPSQPSQPDPTATPTATPDAMMVFESEWADLIEAAQAEGEVIVVMGGSASRNYRPVMQAFQDKFGITTTVSTGGGGAQTDRILAEQSAGRYDADIMMVGGTSAARIMRAGGLDPIPPELIHPEVTSGDGWFQGRLWYADADTEQFILNHGAAASPYNMSMRYNTDVVTQADLDAMNSVYDYLDPKWANKIVAIPAIAEGAGGTYSGIILHPDVGEEWLERFVDPDFGVTFSTDFRFITDSVAGGRFAMGIAIGSAGRDLDGLADQGGPVDRMFKPFAEADTLSGAGAGDNLQMLTNRPHPNAARLLANWFLSIEGQTARHELSEGSPNPSLRDDIPCTGKVDPRECRQAGASYIYLTGDPEYALRTEEALERSREIHRAARGG